MVPAVVTGGLSRHFIVFTTLGAESPKTRCNKVQGGREREGEERCTVGIYSKDLEPYIVRIYANPVIRVFPVLGLGVYRQNPIFVLLTKNLF